MKKNFCLFSKLVKSYKGNGWQKVGLFKFLKIKYILSPMQVMKMLKKMYILKSHF